MPAKPNFTPAPWKWQGEDYRGGWGWQMLVGPSGEGLIIGQGRDGGIEPRLRACMPIDPELCITGLLAGGKERVECVHVFGLDNANLIKASPRLYDGLAAIRDVFAENGSQADYERAFRVGGILALLIAEGKEPSQ